MPRMTNQYKTVEEYIASFPPDVQAKLRQMRKTIAAAAPGAQEKIAYGIPTSLSTTIWCTTPRIAPTSNFIRPPTASTPLRTSWRPTRHPKAPSAFHWTSRCRSTSSAASPPSVSRKTRPQSPAKSNQHPYASPVRRLNQRITFCRFRFFRPVTNGKISKRIIPTTTDTKINSSVTIPAYEPTGTL